MKTLLVRIFLIGVIPSIGTASPLDDKKVQEAKSLATLLRSCRTVISDNQALINDAEKADKGMSGAVVIDKCKEVYKTITGTDVPADDDHRAMFASVSDVMERVQPLINEKGKGFKGFIPAIFATQVASKFSFKRKGKAFIKLTAPPDYLRNRANRADDWEVKIIEEKFKSASWKKGELFAEQAVHRGAAATRVILPEYYNGSCLSCHGDPKGEKDITGGTKEGAKEGDLGGAISVAIY
ncbi:MAG: DUF3365 domain-containing protein [Oligoflexales bacterium]